MRIGVFTQPPTVPAAVEEVRRVADAGFASVWMPQIFGIDAITALTVAAHEVP